MHVIYYRKVEYRSVWDCFLTFRWGVWSLFRLSHYSDTAFGLPRIGHEIRPLSSLDSFSSCWIPSQTPQPFFLGLIFNKPLPEYHMLTSEVIYPGISPMERTLKSLFYIGDVFQNKDIFSRRWLYRMPLLSHLPNINVVQSNSSSINMLSIISQ